MPFQALIEDRLKAELDSEMSRKALQQEKAELQRTKADLDRFSARVSDGTSPLEGGSSRRLECCAPPCFVPRQMAERYMYSFPYRLLLNPHILCGHGENLICRSLCYVWVSVG